LICSSQPINMSIQIFCMIKNCSRRLDGEESVDVTLNLELSSVLI
jgi:hypothetical protein